MIICGFVPPTPGYRPCTRAVGHEGPCAHELSKFERVIVITVTEQHGAAEWQTDRFMVESDFPNVSVQAAIASQGINFIKGAVMAAMGELLREIPDYISIRFKIQKGG